MTASRSHLRVGLTAGRLAGRRLLGLRPGARDDELGAVLTEQLDEMKGLAMKVGQIVSYMDVPLPETVQARLAVLQTGVRGLDEDAIRGALEAAWGDGFEARFDRFDWEPVAAASIGQVHRARLHSGDEVAVKVRYPDVAACFRADVDALGRLAGLAGLASAVDGRAIVAELAARLEEECDYRREAAHQEAFRVAFADSPGVRIPPIHAAFTTETTMVSSWAEGLRYEAARELAAVERDRFATELTWFSYRSLFERAAVQADPHPGNFLFVPGGTVVCLDFGCVRRFEVSFVALLRRIVRALADHDRRAFRDAVIELGMAPRPARFDFDHHFAMMEHVHRPLLAESFEFTPDFVREGMRYNGPTSPNARTMAMPAPYVWVARLQWGLWSLAARLGARVHLRGMLDRLLAVDIHPLLLEAPPCPAP